MQDSAQPGTLTLRDHGGHAWLAAAALAAVAAAGSLDPAFGQNGVVTATFNSNGGATPSAQLVQPDGRILVGGLSAHCFGRPCTVQAALLRYTSNGSLDSGFGSGGIVLSGAKVPLATVARTALGRSSPGKLSGFSHS